MKTPFTLALLRRGALGILLTILLAACNDNPVGDDDDDHAEVIGLVLRQDGITVVTDWEGQMTGRLTVAVDEGPRRVDVIFLDRDSTEVHAEDLGDDFSFAVDPAADPAVAQASLVDAGAFAFQLEGLQAGSTTVKLGLKHGGDQGHYDFSRNVPIDVMP